MKDSDIKSFKKALTELQIKDLKNPVIIEGIMSIQALLLDLEKIINWKKIKKN